MTIFEIIYKKFAFSVPVASCEPHLFQEKTNLLPLYVALEQINSINISRY